MTGLVLVAGSVLFVGAFVAMRSVQRTGMRRELAALTSLVVAAISVPAGVVLALLSAVGTCDESCDPSTGLWRDDPGAWQWDAMAILALIGAATAIALCVMIVRACVVAAWAAALGYGAAVILLAAIWLTPSAEGDARISSDSLLFVAVLAALVGAALTSCWLVSGRGAQSA